MFHVEQVGLSHRLQSRHNTRAIVKAMLPATKGRRGACRRSVFQMVVALANGSSLHEIGGAIPFAQKFPIDQLTLRKIPH